MHVCSYLCDTLLQHLETFGRQTRACHACIVAHMWIGCLGSYSWLSTSM